MTKRLTLALYSPRRNICRSSTATMRRVGEMSQPITTELSRTLVEMSDSDPSITDGFDLEEIAIS